MSDQIKQQIKELKAKLKELEYKLKEAELAESPHKRQISIFTDGSCLGNVAKDNPPAGWAYVVVQKTPECESKVTFEHFGPVIIDEDSEEFIGADKFSNNTAELTAIYFALCYIKQHFRDPRETITIRYDSVYAAKSVMGIFNGPKNRELISNCRKKLKECNGLAKIKFEHVKAHSGHKYNDIVDNLAKEGARQSKKRKLN
jgi:ribonuclease HI